MWKFSSFLCKCFIVIYNGWDLNSILISLFVKILTKNWADVVYNNLWILQLFSIFNVILCSHAKHSIILNRQISILRIEKFLESRKYFLIKAKFLWKFSERTVEKLMMKKNNFSLSLSILISLLSIIFTILEMCLYTQNF